MTVLALNVGSSSVKFRLVNDRDESLRCGQVERLGTAEVPKAVRRVLDEVATVPGAQRPSVVAHRVVHGGDRFRGPTVVDDGVLAELSDLARLAPLHNPPAVAAIETVRELLPGLPQVACFDTAWFADLPAAAATYAIDHEVALREGVRRHGMHGLSHEYVAGEAAALLGRPLADLDLITLHLGNGASAAAIRGGRPVDTSMGMTPLAGLVMGTRPGDVDPGVLLHLLRHGGLDVDALGDLLEHRSGLLGLCGLTDYRDVLTAVADGDPRARLAHDVVCHRLRLYLGGYLAVLGGADAVVFTGGIGEHAAPLRQDVMSGLGVLGLVLDPDRNTAAGERARRISADGSAVQVLVVPTDEELAIARQARRLLAG